MFMFGSFWIGYNPSTGIFQAKVAGTYVFCLTQMSTNSHGKTDLAIVQNGHVLDLLWTEGSGDAYDQGSTQVTTHLNVGDQVSL